MSDTAFFERQTIPGAGDALGSGEWDAPAMNTERGWDSRDPGLSADLPPIRIPVTPRNQSILRELRARELELWEESMPGGEGGAPTDSEAPGTDRESRLILFLLGGGALALWLQASTLAAQLLAGWDRFRAWWTMILGV
ncbi:MAG: hypothetical protein AB7O66_17280 [Limisphaerales bacterium]